MKKGYFTVSDGTFSLSETDVKNQFYFYRNDGGELTENGHEPMDLYQVYIMHQMMSGKMDVEAVCQDIKYEMSGDRKVIRMTVRDTWKRSLLQESDSSNSNEDFLVGLPEQTGSDETISHLQASAGIAESPSLAECLRDFVRHCWLHLRDWFFG